MSRFLDGPEVLEPGIVSIADWRADDDPAYRLTPTEAGIYGVVTRRD